MPTNKIRNLNADEIDARVSQVFESGVVLLLYKDARVDQKILDETYGPMNWKRSHQLIGDNLYCTVSIWDPEKKEWVEKQDVGTESFTEAQKGQASDSFKRACFNWGIGRELYTAPFIWCKAEKLKDAGVEFVKKNDFKTGKGKWTVKGCSPEVTSISYDESGNIKGLTITNKGKEIYKK